MKGSDMLARTLAACLGFTALLGAAQAEDLPIKVATADTPPSINNLYLHVAYEKGFFAKYGLKVTAFQEMSSGPLATQAVAGNQSDLTATDPETALQAAISGYAVRSVSAPGQKLTYYIAVRKDITSLADLKGKPFAVSRPGAISQYMLFPALDKEHVEHKAIQWLAVGGGRQRMLALTQGRVEGALLHLDFALEAQSDPNIVLRERIVDSLPDYPFEVLMLRKQLIDQHPEAALGVTEAVIDACRYIMTNKAGTLEVYKKYNKGANMDLADKAYDALVKMQAFGVDGGLSAKNANIAMQMAVDNKSIDKAVPLESWVDLSFQDKALKALGPFKQP
jgi:NitT/TauT family transport system substrate-binding protein